MEQVVGKIERLLSELGILERSFLVASVLPSSLFLTLFIATSAYVLGIAATWSWLRSASTLELVLSTSLLVLLLLFLSVAFALVRTRLMMLWALITLPLPQSALGALERWQEYRYRTLDARAAASPRWDRRTDRLESDFAQPAPAKESSYGWFLVFCAARRRLRALSIESTDAEVERLYKALHKCRAVRPERFPELARRVLFRFDKFRRLEVASRATAVARLHREFALSSGGILRPTELGNAMDAYSRYSFDRFAADGGLLWPHLQAILEPTQLARLKDAKARVDASLALSTALICYGLLCALVGPLVWTRFDLWFLLSVAACFLSYASYRVAVQSAYGFGEIVRSSWDLYHGVLFERLALPGQTKNFSLAMERSAWQRIARLSAFGQPRG